MSKTKLTLLAKLAVTCGLLALVLRGVAFEEIETRLASIDPGPLLLAVLLIVMQMLCVVVWRWSAILRVIGASAALPKLMRYVIIGHFFNQFLPSTVGGDGMRAWLLRRGGAGLGTAVRSVILDRTSGLFALMLFSFAGCLFLLPLFLQSPAVWAGLGLSSFGILCVAGAPLWLRLFGWVPIAAIPRHLETLASEVDSLRSNGRLLAAILAVSLLGHVMLALAVWLTAQSIGVDMPLFLSLAIIPTVLLLSAVPISVGGWGVREGGMVVGLGLLGVQVTDAALVSVFFGALMLVVALPCGLLWVLDRAPRPPAETLDPTALEPAPLDPSRPERP